MSSPTVTWSPDCVLKIVNISFKFNETVNHSGNFINILQIQLDFLTTFWVNSRQQGVRQSGKFTIFMKCLWYIAIKEFLQKEPLFEFLCKWKTEIGRKNTCKFCQKLVNCTSDSVFQGSAPNLIYIISRNFVADIFLVVGLFWGDNNSNNNNNNITATTNNNVAINTTQQTWGRKREKKDLSDQNENNFFFWCSVAWKFCVWIIWTQFCSPMLRIESTFKDLKRLARLR